MALQSSLIDWGTLQLPVKLMDDEQTLIDPTGRLVSEEEWEPRLVTIAINAHNDLVTENATFKKRVEELEKLLSELKQGIEEIRDVRLRYSKTDSITMSRNLALALLHTLERDALKAKEEAP